MYEDKQLIMDLLCKTLQATRNASDVVSLGYDADSETVLVTFASGGFRIVNVAMDSGTAMIRDVMTHLGC